MEIFEGAGDSEVKTASVAESQSSSTPAASSAIATSGQRVVRRFSWTIRVSAALHAAG